jgi:hypothetical protein
MRLFEVDLGSARDVLAVLQGQANSASQSSTIPFSAVIRLLAPYDLGINTPDGLIALKNAVDPAGDVIQDIDDQGNVILNTGEANPNQPQEPTGSPAVDAMASSNAKELSPDI